MADYQIYVERVREYVLKTEGINSLSNLASKARELSDLLIESMIPDPSALNEPMTI